MTVIDPLTAHRESDNVIQVQLNQQHYIVLYPQLVFNSNYNSSCIFSRRSTSESTNHIFNDIWL